MRSIRLPCSSARRGTAAVALAILLVLALPAVAPDVSVRLDACGPFPSPYGFARAVFPDAPRYADGRLGVVQPTFARKYLFAAWRYVNGVPLSARERAAVAERTDPWTARDAAEPGRAVQQWLSVRRTIAGAGEPVSAIQQFKALPGTGFAYYLNCPDAAFIAAAQSLTALIKEKGAANPETVGWTDTQDAVFKRCSATADAIGELPESASASARAERRYQLAAAAFYDGEWNEAERRFRDIARDTGSRWQPWGRYLAGRVLLRRATLSSKADEPFDAGVIGSAERELQAVVGETRRADIRRAAEATLRLIRIKTNPAAMAVAIGRQLATARDGEGVAADLDDYRHVLDRLVGDTVEYSFDQVAEHRQASADELTDWILTFQASGAGSLEHALERWRTLDRVAWLIAVASKIPANHAETPHVLEAAAGVPEDSPAFATLAFHRARLLIEAGRGAEARTVMDGVLSRPGMWPASTVNLFRAARLLTARSLDEFLTDAVRARVVDAQYLRPDGGPRAGAAGFDTDATDLLNEHVPLPVLAAAAESLRLPADLRRQVAESAFMRSVLLDDDASTAALARSLAAQAPDLRKDLQPVVDAPSPGVRRAEAWLVALRSPGLRPFVPREPMRDANPRKIDNFRDNWWCSFAPEPASPSSPDTSFRRAPYETGYWRYTRDDRVLRPLYPDPAAARMPPFLSDADRAQAAREREQIARRGAAPNDLARQALTFVQLNATDPRAPEALYLAVRATRYGCTDGGTSKLSKAAFDRLHQAYPQSSWTKRTPYWYR